MALTLEQIRSDVADSPGGDPADIALDENLMDYGLESVRIMAFVERWRREHGVAADCADLAGHAAVKAWAPLLEVS